MIDLKQIIGWYFLVLGLLSLGGAVFGLGVPLTSFPPVTINGELFFYPLRVAQWIFIYSEDAVGISGIGQLGGFPIGLVFILLGYLLAIRGRRILE